MMNVRELNKKCDGFTLIEVIIYTAIFASMIGFLAVSVFQLLDTQKSGQDRISVESETDFLIGKIDWALSGAQSINLPVANTTGTVLSINKINYSDNPIVFDIASGTARITKGASAPIQLTSGDVSINKFEVNHLPQVANRPEGISIIITAIASTTAQVQASTTINNSFYLNK